MKTILLFLAAAGTGLAFITIIYFSTTQENTQVINKPSLFSTNKAPSSSLNGQLISLAGGVGWQSREATEASKLQTLQSIQQGEKIVTDASGSATVQYNNLAQVKISSNTDLDFVQSLPSNFVFMQNNGTVTYQRLGNIPLSIRALHLLIDQNSGEIKVVVNKKDDTVAVSVNKGQITVAFNNLDLVSNLLTVGEGKQLIFDDSNRKTKINNL